MVSLLRSFFFAGEIFPKAIREPCGRLDSWDFLIIQHQWICWAEQIILWLATGIEVEVLALARIIQDL